MRLQIESLESLTAEQAKRVVELERLGVRSREIVQMTAEVLGRHFITLDPSTIEVKHIDSLSETWRVAVSSQIPACLDWRENGSDIDQQTFCEIALPIMRGGRIADNLRLQQHFRFTYAGRKVGYGIQESSLRMMHPDDAVNQIAREMAEFIVGDVSKPSPEQPPRLAKTM